jgi:hypothetical protein
MAKENGLHPYLNHGGGGNAVKGKRDMGKQGGGGKEERIDGFNNVSASGKVEGKGLPAG